LAAWLHASVPQAHAFAAEAGRLERRLAEDAGATSALRATESTVLVRPRRAPGCEEALAPGALPGLDETLSARLAGQHVHTLRALADGAGLELARRTGIPYGKLLELARAARSQLARAMPRERSPTETRVVEVAPFLALAPPKPVEAELLPSDHFTLPPAEPGPGPFG
jgi:hypothetical protein